MKNIKKEIYAFLPKELIDVLNVAITDELWKSIDEIRIFKCGYIIICSGEDSMCINNLYKLTKDENNPYITSFDLIDNIFNIVTNFSSYAYDQYISQGYITVKGGHRIGIGGSIHKGYSKNYIFNINALNIRICKDIDNYGMDVASKICCGNRYLNTVIISPPKCGKTTMLRNIIRNISQINIFPNICVIDERKELCSANNGISSFDLGKNTFVIDSLNKSKGIKMAIESLSPQIIVCDEITTHEEADSLYRCILSGVQVIFSCHGRNYNDFLKKFSGENILKEMEFYVELNNSCGPGTISKMARCVQ